jgi:hypothetical protein
MNILRIAPALKIDPIPLSARDLFVAWAQNNFTF